MQFYHLGYVLGYFSKAKLGNQLKQTSEIMLMVSAKN